MGLHVNHRKAFLAAGVAIGALAIPTTASAQQTAETATGNDIIVTANKREQRLLDVASSVSALGGQDLARRNLLQVEDFAAQVPGLAVQQFGNRATRIIIRGLNSGGPGATVATVFDEAPISYSSSTSNGAIDIANFDTYDLNRVEVLRGPQGTLYGATAQGGLIKYVTNAPDPTKFDAGGDFTVQHVDQGEFGTNVRAFVNVPIVDDRLALRVTGFYKLVEGFVDNTLQNRPDDNSGERYGVRAQLLFNATDNLSIRLMALTQRQNFDNESQVELVGAALTPGNPPSNAFDVANGGNLERSTRNPQSSQNKTDLFSGVIDWDIGFANLISATSYGTVKSTFRRDISDSELAPGFNFGTAFGGIFGKPFINIYGDQTNDLAKFSQELRLSSKPDFEVGGLDVGWQGGLFYTHEDITFNQFYDFVDDTTKQILGPPIPGGSELPANYDEIAVFGTVRLNFNERFNIEMGGRYAWNWQDSTVTNYAGFLNGPADIFNPTYESKESKFTWSIAPQFFINPDAQVYARIATGYRPGGPSLAIPLPPPDYPRSYTSDSTINYEIGFKGELFDKLLSIDLAAFWIEWTDIQILTTFLSGSGQQFSVTGNAGKAESKGFEWNIGLTPMEGLRFGVVGAYTDAKLTEDAVSLGAFSGDQLTYVPEWTNTVNIDYDHKIGDDTVFIGGSWVYTGARYTTFVSANPSFGHTRLPSYSVFNAQGGVEFSRFRMELFVRNIGNSRGLATYEYSGGYQSTGLGQIVQPRTVGVRFGVKY